MEPHGKIPWYLVNYPDRRMIKNDSTTAIDCGFLYIGIKFFVESVNIESSVISFLQINMINTRFRDD